MRRQWTQSYIMSCSFAATSTLTVGGVHTEPGFIVDMKVVACLGFSSGQSWTLAALEQLFFLPAVAIYFFLSLITSESNDAPFQV